MKNQRFHKAILKEILVVTVIEGGGYSDDEFRDVTYFLDPKSGTVLAKHDPKED